MAACKLTPADPSNFQFDFHAPAGPVKFTVAVHSGSGSAAFAGFSLDGKTQTPPVPTPLTVNLANGGHVLRFVVAFSDPTAVGVIQEACDPPRNLALVSADHPLREIRISVP